jgi:hypothetical protein
MSITPEKAAQLRAQFPPESIGKLPKPYKADNPKGECKECGGWHGLPAMHLDYVGHANTTNRLLEVDPEWSWEPMATDERGLPITDGKGNLWIRLTICGVTRIGVGDGKSAKECIGDAIRNAAMRFGVDLWSKEELEQGSGPARRRKKADDAPPPSEPSQETRRMSRPVKSPREKKEAQMFALFKDTGHTDKDDMLAYISTVAARPIESRTDITDDELTAVIAELQVERGAAS